MHVFLVYGERGLIYGRHLMLIIKSIVLVNYSLDEKKYKHIVYNIYIKQVG
jgi:hypothetical protein